MHAWGDPGSLIGNVSMPHLCCMAEYFCYAEPSKLTVSDTVNYNLFSFSIVTHCMLHTTETEFSVRLWLLLGAASVARCLKGPTHSASQPQNCDM